MLANAPVERLRMRNPAPGPFGGGLYVSELQRTRLLDAACEVVAERGYRGMAVRAVSERAGVSSKTFYDLFEDRESCFLAAFDHGIEQLTARARPAYKAQRDWTAGIRAALAGMLAFLDEEPALCHLVFVEALAAGPRVLARRARVLQELAGVIDEGRVDMKAADELPTLTAEGVVGAAFGVIHARLSPAGWGEASRSRTQGAWRATHASDRGRRDAPPLAALLNPLMATIVLPYRGRAASAREFARSAPPSERRGATGSKTPEDAEMPSVSSLTVRRYLALAAVAELNGHGSAPSNREIAERVGVTDESQVSRLMMSLQAQALLEDTRTEAPGNRKAWRVTPAGDAAMHANRPYHPEPTASAIPLSFRLSARSHAVLNELARLNEQGVRPNNREIADGAGVSASTQISGLLARLQARGLVANSGGAGKGIPHAWRLTPRGEELVSASRIAAKGAKQ